MTKGYIRCFYWMKTKRHKTFCAIERSRGLPLLSDTECTNWTIENETTWTNIVLNNNLYWQFSWVCIGGYIHQWTSFWMFRKWTFQFLSKIVTRFLRLVQFLADGARISSIMTNMYVLVYQDHLILKNTSSILW